MYWDWEFQFLNWIQDTLRSPFWDGFWSFITKFGDAGIFWIVLSLCLFIPKRTRKVAHMSSFALLLGVIIGNVILKNVIGRSRPFWIDNNHPFSRVAMTVRDGITQYALGHKSITTELPDGRSTIELLVKAPSDYCFPSGHTQASFAASTSIFIWNRKYGIPALVLAVLVAFSRMYLYVHYPTDILGGIISGVVCACISAFICSKLFKNKPWEGCAGYQPANSRPKREKAAVH